MIKYTPEQEKAINYPSKPLLLLAGAGTGKTTTIVARIVKLISKDGYSPSKILALTYTNEAAKHLKSKLYNQLGDIGNDIIASTFHSLAQTISNENYKELGYNRKPMIMNNCDIIFLMRSKFNDLPDLLSQDYRINPNKSIFSIVKIIDTIKQNLFSDNEIINIKKQMFNEINIEEDSQIVEHKKQIIDIINIMPFYDKWKKESNWIDYGDMIWNLWWLIKNNNKFLKSIRKKFTHVIIDEFQDNNYALSSIIHEIVYPDNRITVVGDDDQCIYSFRQANVQNLHEFIEKYYRSDQKPICLMKNYRSDQLILNLANKVISFNRGRLYKGELKSINKGINKPILYIGDKNEQIIKLGNDIQKLIINGEEPQNIAVLLRTNPQCIEIANYLNKIGICSYYNSDKLYNQSVIKDIISVLYILSNSESANHGWIRLLKKYISNNNLILLLNNNLSDYKLFIERILDSDICRDNNLIDLLNNIKRIQWKNISELIWDIILMLNIFRKVSTYSFYKQKQIFKSINQFIEVVISYCNSYSPNDINKFVKFIKIQCEINEDRVETIDEFVNLPSVQIMTVHSAKGMEYKHVMLPFLRSGSFPLNFKRKKMIDRLPIELQRWNSSNLNEKELHYEEERRLFYVAITRAICTISLYAPKTHQSIFIKNLDENLYNVKEIMLRQNISDIDILIGEYQSMLQMEIHLKNYDGSKHLLEVIKNLHLIKQNKKINWGLNPYKEEIERILHKEKIKTDSSIKPKISATQLETYKICPLKYKYKYLDNFPTMPYKSLSNIGTTIHRVLEEFHKNNFTLKQQLFALLDEYWDEIKFTYFQEKEQSKYEAKEMLQNYWDYLKNNENKLSYQFIEHSFDFETDYAYITGKCDRIDIDKNGLISIIDYKTSRKSITSKKIKKDIQMGIYTLFIYSIGVKINENTFIKGVPEKLIMLYLRQNDIELSTGVTEEDISTINSDIKSIVEDIKNKNFEPEKGTHCDWCDYKDLICPIYG